MKKLIVISILLLFFINCRKNDPTANVPACILEKLEEYKGNSLKPGALLELDEYMYQDKIVYYFSIDGSADAPSIVMPNDCSIYCYIGGYRMPPVDLCNGERFFEKAVLKRIIWKR